MVDYVGPITRKKSDVIIMHVGSKALTKAVNAMSKVRKIVSVIQETDSTRNIQLGFSSIVQRTDTSHSKKIKDISTRLKSYCLGKGLIFVDNSNIDESCLNNNKLHLSKKGTQLLTQNILISLDGHWTISQQTVGNDIRNSHLSCSQDFSQKLKNRLEYPANPTFETSLRICKS